MQEKLAAVRDFHASLATISRALEHIRMSKSLKGEMEGETEGGAELHGARLMFDQSSIFRFFSVG